MIRAVGLQKWACAEANQRLGELPAEIAEPIKRAAQEVADGPRDAEFPLPVWQTGTGTQTNMNANEVISNRANELLGQPLGSRKPVHPNDHVNRGQSSNDNFPTVMHIAAAEAVEGRLLPGLGRLHAALWPRSEEWAGIVKIGRTHLMDAVPVTLGQEFGAWARQVELGQRAAARRAAAAAAAAAGRHRGRHRAQPPPGFRRASSARSSPSAPACAFTPNPNKFEGMGAHDALVELSGVMNTIAVSLNKIGNDIRLLGSGPRAGFAELVIPADGSLQQHHAGQDQPDPVRGADHGLRPGDGQHTSPSPSPARRGISS